MNSTKNYYWNMAIHSFMLYSIFAVVNPHFSILLQLKGYSSFYIGIFMGIFFLSGLFGPIGITGLLQRYNKYKLFFCLLIISGALFIISLVIVDWFFLLCLLIFLFGCVFSSLVPVSDAMLVDLLRNPYREYGTIRAIGTLGFITMALLIAVFRFVNINNEVSIGAMIAYAYMLMLGVSIIVLPKYQAKNSNAIISNLKIKVVIKSIPKIYWMVLIIVFFNFIGLATLNVYLSLYLKTMYNVNNVTLVWMIAAVSELLGLVWGQRIVTRIGYSYALLIALIATVTRLLILAISNTLYIVYASQVLHVFSFAIILTTMIHFVNHHIKVENKPIVLGINQASMAVARVVASLIGGYLIYSFNYSVLFYSMGFIVFIGIIFTIFFHKKLQLY